MARELRRASGLPRARGPDRRADARPSTRASSTAWSGSSGSTRSSARGASPIWRAARSTACSPRSAGRSWLVGRVSTCARRCRTWSFDRRSGLELRDAGGARDRGTRARGPACTSSTPELAGDVHANDRKRIARLTELQRAGFEPPPPGGGELWTAQLRHPTLLVGLVVDRDDLGAPDRHSRGRAGRPRRGRRGSRRRGGGTLAHGPGRARVRAAPVRRTSRRMKRAHRAYARRQLTWMRKMPGRDARRQNRPRRFRRGGGGRRRTRARLGSLRCGSRSGRRSATTT